MDEKDQLLDQSTANQLVDRPDRLPPIRILDLMALTAAMAFVFMIQSQWMDVEPQAFNTTAWLVLSMVAAVPAGIAFASIFWIANQKRITGRFLIQPGHWILASYALDTTFTFAFWLFLFRNSELNSPGLLTPFFASLGLTYFAAGGLMIFGLFFTPIRWWGVIASLATSYGISGMSFMVNLTMINAAPAPAMHWIAILEYGKFAANTICILFLIIAMVVDIRKKTSRDWLHWAGTLVLFLAFGVQPIVQMIVIRFFLILNS